MNHYLDPKIDLAFKRLFGEHADLLKSFLNALLPLPEDALIDSLTYLSPEQAPDIPGLFKNSIVDVKCTDTKGRVFVVEMQMFWTPAFDHRIVFGASQAYVKQLKAGQEYRKRPAQPSTDIFHYRSHSIFSNEKRCTRWRGMRRSIVIGASKSRGGKRAD